MQWVWTFARWHMLQLRCTSHTTWYTFTHLLWNVSIDKYEWHKLCRPCVLHNPPGKVFFVCCIPGHLLLICLDIHHVLCPAGTSDHLASGNLSTTMRKRFPLWGWGMNIEVKGKVTPSLDRLLTTVWLEEVATSSPIITKCSGFSLPLCDL